MEQLLKAVETKQGEMLSFLEKLVNIDSGIDHPAGIAAVAHIIGDKLQELGFAVEYLEYPGFCTITVSIRLENSFCRVARSRSVLCPLAEFSAMAFISRRLLTIS